MLFIKLRFTILRLLERIVKKYREAQGDAKVLRHMAKSAERDKDKNETSFVFYEGLGVEISQNTICVVSGYSLRILHMLRPQTFILESTLKSSSPS